MLALTGPLQHGGPRRSETPLPGACLASTKGTVTLLQLLFGFQTLCASVSSPENQGWVLLAQGLALETRSRQGRGQRGAPDMGAPSCFRRSPSPAETAPWARPPSPPSPPPDECGGAWRGVRVSARSRSGGTAARDPRAGHPSLCV